jgi:antitoxin (DNA-binding transcriptional repressor) of toxin-antitoxin stability system
MQKVNMHQAKTHLSRYVDLAAGGEEILIARAGKPVARPVALPTTATKGLESGKGTFQDS